MLDGIQHGNTSGSKRTSSSPLNRGLEDSRRDADRDADGRYIPLHAFVNQGEENSDEKGEDTQTELPKLSERRSDALELDGNAVVLGFLSWLERTEEQLQLRVMALFRPGAQRQLHQMKSLNSAYSRTQYIDDGDPVQETEEFVARMSSRIRNTWDNLGPSEALPAWFDAHLDDVIRQVFSHDPMLHTFPKDLQDLTRSIPDSIRLQLAS